MLYGCSGASIGLYVLMALLVTMGMLDIEPDSVILAFCYQVDHFKLFSSDKCLVSHMLLLASPGNAQWLTATTVRLDWVPSRTVRTRCLAQPPSL